MESGNMEEWAKLAGFEDLTPSQHPGPHPPPTPSGQANAHYFLDECGLEPSGLLLGWPTWSPRGACTRKCPREGPDLPVWRLWGRAWPPQAGSGVTSADRASPHSAPSVVWKERLGELYLPRFLVMTVLLPSCFSSHLEPPMYSQAKDTILALFLIETGYNVMPSFDHSTNRHRAPLWTTHHA